MIEVNKIRFEETDEIITTHITLDDYNKLFHRASTEWAEEIIQENSEILNLFWSDCASPGCKNKCCLGLSSKYCFPHTPGWWIVKEFKIWWRRCDYRQRAKDIWTILRGGDVHKDCWY
jgi:hypothetical protein